MSTIVNATAQGRSLSDIGEGQKRKNIGERAKVDTPLQILNVEDVSMDCSGVLTSELLEPKIKETEKVFVETRGFQRVRQTLQEFGHVTVTGSVGDGKTSMALMLGEEYRRKHGYKILMVEDVDRFNIRFLLQSRDQPSFVIFDDIFGSVSFRSEMGQITKQLRHLQLLLKTEDMPVFFSRGQILRLVFTTKTYNLNEALHKVESDIYSKFFSNDAIVDLNRDDISYTYEEKQKISDKYKTTKHVKHFEPSDLVSNQWGFPLLCKIYFEHGVKDINHFKSPITFLRKELSQLLLEKSGRSAALILMLLCEDKLSLVKVEMPSGDSNFETKLEAVMEITPDVTRTYISTSAKFLRGTYFSEGDLIGFTHPVMYDACALAFATQNIAFVLKHCSLKFLCERVRGCSDGVSDVSDENSIICISSEYYTLLVERLVKGVRDRQYSVSLTHPMLKIDTVTDMVAKSLSQQSSVFDENIQEILYWVVRAHNANLFKTMFRNICDLTEENITTIINGCASCGNDDALKMLLSNDNLHVQDSVLFEALLLASQNNHRHIVEYLKGFLDRQHMERVSTFVKMMTDVPATVFSWLTLSGLFRLKGQTAFLALLAMAAYTGQHTVFKYLMMIFELTYDKMALQITDKNGNTIFHIACEGGNTSIVEHLLPFSDINSQGQNGWTPVMKAAYSGKKEVFDLLVSKGADLTLNDYYGDIVLVHACRGGNTSIVKHLLSLSDINHRGENGATPVMHAALCGEKDVLDLLVKKGADLNLIDTNGHTILHYACRGGNASIVKHLLSSCDVNCRGDYDATPVMHAASCGEKEVLDLLVTKGADLTLTDLSGNNVLHYACQGGNTSIVKYLLPLSDINCRGQNGATPVMYAAIYDEKAVFGLLVTKGADLNITDTSGNTVLHYACRGGNIPIVKHLLSSFDINCQGDDDTTPVMHAALCGEKEVLDLLVTKGADLTLTDLSGDNVLHYACQGGNTSIVKYLLPLSDINCRGQNGATPVMHAAISDEKAVFGLLVTKGADLNITDTSGNTVLHYACRGGNTSIVKHLLSSCDVNCRGDYDATPVMHAALCGEKEVLDLLVTKGADLTLTDDFDQTALHYAYLGGNASVVKQLLPLPDVNCYSPFGMTFARTAILFGHLRNLLSQGDDFGW